MNYGELEKKEGERERERKRVPKKKTMLSLCLTVVGIAAFSSSQFYERHLSYRIDEATH